VKQIRGQGEPGESATHHDNLSPSTPKILVPWLQASLLLTPLRKLVVPALIRAHTRNDTTSQEILIVLFGNRSDVGAMKINDSAVLIQFNSDKRSLLDAACLHL